MIQVEKMIPKGEVGDLSFYLSILGYQICQALFLGVSIYVHKIINSLTFAINCFCQGIRYLCHLLTFKMAGIYFHIPFCKQACHYCDFHFSTSLRDKEEMIKAMLKELSMRKDYLNDREIESIYFGGGTPSLLSGDEISELIDAVSCHHSISPDVEITLEANPDDLHASHIGNLRKTAINRFSIGVQSFYEADLKWMNRAHNASEAESAIKRVQDAGFENITADLIYGYPLLSDHKWENNIKRMISFQVPHISAYSMTVEPKTALGSFIKKGLQKPMDEDQSAAQFLQLMKIMAEKEYEQYEISNFAHAEAYSRHNSNYWRGIPYLGIGPSAHSYDSVSRCWNISNNLKYIRALEIGELPAEEERLSETDQINEYIMTSLRTKWGMDLGFIEKKFHPEAMESLKRKVHHYIEEGLLLKDKETYILTTSGKLLADHISSELFIEGFELPS